MCYCPKQNPLVCSWFFWNKNTFFPFLVTGWAAVNGSSGINRPPFRRDDAVGSAWNPSSLWNLVPEKYLGSLSNKWIDPWKFPERTWSFLNSRGCMTKMPRNQDHLKLAPPPRLSMAAIQPPNREMGGTSMWNNVGICAKPKEKYLRGSVHAFDMPTCATPEEASYHELLARRDVSRGFYSLFPWTMGNPAPPE